ncbi:TIGR03620 family F420-dependent LLM class oxidoreductase [Mycolicibacterium sp. P1-18]|uniref:TIGR03620 family F420-dependent LLM class oxidoreductase n=1 Tax=Mycolicibacterium sp. P1-18 TaxID=2024615 RepID=UPI0011F2ECC8|nr:TIGR03620 family F420-dependent LLM class oxidoreductase [Mycolicibacterium sp. P1-18]KAA0097633.1 TIGR03620 family F420-dependent LLM class oxidoreductase [Mycolicibacterium sp. P1-18]
MNVNTVEAARQAIGPVGALLPVTFTEAPSAHAQRDAVERLERAGYPCTWTNEVFGKDALVQLALLLAATRRMVFGTGVANVWVREPQTLAAAAAQLAAAHPGRFILGLGVGYPQQAEVAGRDYGRPLATMREYQRRMGEVTWPPVPDADYPRIVAANGPKMLELAAETADGALPAGLPADYTAQARRVLGPDKLLVVGLSVVVDSDPERARETARATVSASLNSPAYAKTIAALGYSAGADDRLVDAVVGHGHADAVANLVRSHLAAGADHVSVMMPGGDFDGGVAGLEQLAPTLMKIGATGR